MSDAEDEDFAFQNGVDHVVVAHAILAQSGELAFQNGTRIGLLGEVLFDAGKNAARFGFAQPGKIARDRSFIGGK